MNEASHKNGSTSGAKAVRSANGAKVVRSAFLSHPARTDTSVIRRILLDEGVNVRSDQDIEPGQNVHASVMENMRKADVVIAIFGDRPKNATVFYQMGLADAMGKPVLVVSTGASDPVGELAPYPYLRARPDAEETLRFGLVHFIHAPHRRPTLRKDSISVTKPIGAMVDGLVARLHKEHSINDDELVRVIVTAIRKSGVDTQASVSRGASAEEALADIAVWSDELDSLVGNPLPIEVRSTLKTPQDAEHAAKNLMRAIVGSKVRWGLILFLKASKDAMDVLSNYPVLAMSVEDFLEALREKSFGRIVADLRNRAMHGATADA